MTTNKETDTTSKGFVFQQIRIRLSNEALQWLCGTTDGNSGKPFHNSDFFFGLLARMQLAPCRDAAFRRPQEVQPGVFQYSENRLSEEWNIGRKKTHNLLARMEELGLIAVRCSRMASIAAITCVEGWTDSEGQAVNNPFYTSHSHSTTQASGKRSGSE